MYSSIPDDGPIVAARRILDGYRAALATAPVTTPPGREWMFKLADALGTVLEALDADDDQEDDETYFCSTCGGTISIFIGHGEAWHHYRGQGTAADPVALYDAGHEATFAVVSGGAR